MRRLAAFSREQDANLSRAQQSQMQGQAVVDRLRASLARQQVEVRQAQARMQGLQAWLQGIVPHGLGGYKDDKGREITHAGLRQAYRRFEELHQALSQREQACRETELALEQARQARQSLTQQAEDALLRHQTARQEIKRQTARLRKAQKNLADQGLRLEEKTQGLARMASLRHFYGRLLAQAGEMLQSLHEESGPLPSATLSDTLASAAEQGRRAQRLAHLQLRLAQRLEPLARQVPDQLKQAREINREISGLESSLPGMIKQLTHPDTAVPQARARAAAGLSTLMVRVGELWPQAQEADHQLGRLQTRLERDLERARRWQEAWREAGKTERALLAQASALVEEVRLHAGHCRDRRQDLVSQLAPAVEALGSLCVLDLAPSLAGAGATGPGLAGKGGPAGSLGGRDQRRIARAHLPQPEQAPLGHQALFRRHAPPERQAGELERPQCPQRGHRPVATHAVPARGARHRGSLAAVGGQPGRWHAPPGG